MTVKGRLSNASKRARRKPVNTTDPYGVRIWDGLHKVDNRTFTALIRAQQLAKVPIRLAQGSYSTGVPASAGTHDKGGVVDVRIDGLTTRQRVRVMHSLKRVGFAVWWRHGSLWAGNAHLHAVLRKHKKLAWLAAQQELAYDRRRDGLADNKPDRTWRPKIARHWSHRRNRVVFEV